MKPVTRTASRLPRVRGARIACALAAATALSACLVPNVARSAGQPPLKTAQACVNIEGHTAPVRAIGFTPDSKLLCTAGNDKVVHVWSLPQPDGDESGERAKGVMVVETRGKVRTLRWPMGRDKRGMIYAMAVHPTNGRLVIGGYGNLQLTGEIVELDPYDGEWVGAKYEHHSFASIGALSYSASGSWLASIDGNGRAWLWSSMTGEARELAPPNANRPLTFSRIAIVGDAMVVFPVHDRDVGPGQSIWKLRTYDIARGAFGPVLAADHVGEVTALAASPDGRYFASADDQGNVIVWRPGEMIPWRSLRGVRSVVSMAFSPDGRTLAAGTRLVPGIAGAELQVWDVAAGALLRKRQLPDDVQACAFSPDGRYLAYSGGEGYEVFVESTVSPDDRFTLPARSGGKRVAEVAFAADGTADYNVVFTSLPGGKRRTFSVAGLKARDEAPPAIESGQFMGQWSYLAKPERDPYRLWLYRGQHAQGSVRLDREHGHLISQCWIPGAGGEPAAVAVGTGVENGVFVYGLPRGGECDQLLYCRGHNGRVTSVAASPDSRYLVSGSTDGTVRYWPLRALRDPSPLFRRWGAALQPSASGQGLVVASIDELGPLYQKGVRAGDRIDRIAWNQAEGNTERSGEMLRQLGQLPWNQQVLFTTSGGTQRLFNLRGGWYPMLTLYATDSEWIAWTPAGYYACSAGGERMMGWLMNPDERNLPPKFYTAEQFNERLYKPDVIRQLLREGSLQGAIAMTEDVREEDRVEATTQILPPEVRITSHDPTRGGVELPAGAEIKITAVAEARGGGPITAMRLQLDGSPYKKIGYERGITRDRLKKTESWTLRLEPGRHTIRVVAESEASKGYSQVIELECRGTEIKPTLYVLAIGISEYTGGGVSRLEYGDSDAKQLADILNDRSKDLFGDIQRKVLTNENATRSAIADGFGWLQRSMKPSDVAVVFYSGHGVQDNVGEFYLFPVDGKRDDIRGTCVSDEFVKQFCEETLGKKVLMIDACHSGGIDLTPTSRASVEDLAREFSRDEYSVIMMASSTGEEVSYEHERWGGGAFTKALTEGLRGEADSTKFPDELISTKELDAYVSEAVVNFTDGRQRPVSSQPPIPPFHLTKILALGGW